jgi:hypothetical protein
LQDVSHIIADAAHCAGGRGEDIDACRLHREGRKREIGAFMPVIAKASAFKILRAGTGIVVGGLLNIAGLRQVAVERRL